MSQAITAQAEINIDGCAREPIHIPGSIQPHGYLVGVEEAGLTISQLSANCAELFKAAVQDLLGRSLFDFLAPASRELLQKAVGAANLQRVNPLKLNFAHQEQTVWEVVVQRSQGLLLLEFEPSRGGRNPAFLSIYQQIHAAIEEIGAAKDLAELYRVTVEWVREISGYQRVMIYEFDAEWNGRVVAEVCAPHQEPFLGLHYPASDIPAQARRLYSVNWLRSIPNVHYEPSPIVPGLVQSDGAEAPLDLSTCSLRSVSPVHIQYLKNMGVGASTSISVIKDGILWGLIALHHDQPAYLSYEVRQGLEFIGRIFSIQHAAKQKLENVDYKKQLRAQEAELLTKMKAESTFLHGLLRGEPNFLSLAQGCCGGAILRRGKWFLLGVTPPAEFLTKLVDWLRINTGEKPLFHTTSLAKRLPEAESFSNCASGIVSISIPEIEPCYVLWFKSEVIQTVNWGGNPNKAVQMGEGGASLSPRHSFELWQETVRLTSLPWQPEEIEAIEKLRRSIIEVDLENQVRAAMDSNAELEQFASVIAHDLKEPLRGIHFFSDFLLEDLQGSLDEGSQNYLEEIRRLSGKAKVLIADLYEYAKVGRIDMSFGEVDLNYVVQDVALRLSSYFKEKNAHLHISSPLPRVYCDKVRVGELFANLFTNSAKYNQQTEKVIEVGVNLASTDKVDVNGVDQVPIFYVRDNGIGIAPENRQRVFEMFQRLHTEHEYEGGTGVGLAIVKRIVDRHGGQIWIESTPGQGSTFYFTLRPAKKPKWQPALEQTVQ